MADSSAAVERTYLVARGHRLLGAALAMEGSDLAEAERHLQLAVAEHRQNGEEQEKRRHVGDLCATLFELGNVAAQRGDIRSALDMYSEAARTAEVSLPLHIPHTSYFMALAYNNFAYHSLLLGHDEAARHALAKGKKLAEIGEMFGALQHLASTQGELHLYYGEWAAALDIFQQGLGLAEELGNLERQAGFRAGLALGARGMAMEASGERRGEDLEQAIRLLQEALTLVTEHVYWHTRTRIQIWLAETLLVQGKLDEAEGILAAALVTARAHGRALLMILGERLRARLLAMRGDWNAAHELFDQVWHQAQEMDLLLEAARTQAAWGESMLLYSPEAGSCREGHLLLADAQGWLTRCHAHADLMDLARTRSEHPASF